MISQPGDYIGAGKTYNFTAPSATFTAQVLGSGSYTNDVDIAVTSGNDWFYYDFAAPNLARLVPGVYTGATRWPFEAANTPGLDIDGDGRGSNTLTGQFTVYQALYDGTGQITDFSASFEQHSEGATPALTGQILYHAALNRPAGVLANDADADGDPLTANLVTGPAHGTLMSFGADGSFAYTPAPGFFGTDQFTYRSNDGKANSNLATVTIAVKQTGVVADGGFESAAAGPSGYQYNPTGSSWTFSGGPGNGSGVSGNNSPFTAGNPAAPEGSQVAFLQGTGTITQTITGLAAGSDTLSFQAAQRGNYGTSNEDFQIQVDGVPVGTFRPTSTTYKTYTTPTFTVTAGTHTVRFMGLDSAGGDNTAFLDGVALSVATPPPVGVPALGDAGFESVAVGGTGYVYNPSWSSWTFSGGPGNGSGVSGNNSPFTAGNPAAPEGSQVAFLQGTGTISQAVSNWAAGSYTLSLLAAQRGNYGVSHEDFQVLVDGVLVGTFTPTSTSYQTWQTGSFTVAAGTHTVTLRGLNSAGGDNTVFLDQVRVNSV